MESLQWRFGIIAVVLGVSLFFVYPSVGPVPEFWSKNLPDSPLRLGLDLQGGLHLVLEVEADKAVETMVDQATIEAAAAMKDAKIRYADVQRISPTTMKVVLLDDSQIAAFDQKVVQKLTNFKKTTSRAVGNGYEVDLELDPKLIEGIKKRAVDQAVETIRGRVDDFGVAEPDVVNQGAGRIVVQLPGLKEDINRAKDIIQRTARLEFKIVDETGDPNNPPPGDEVLYEANRNPRTGAVTRTPHLLKKQVLLTGDVITDARVHPDQMGRMYISMEFNRRGAEIFERITTENVKKKLAIILDNRVYSAPQIREPIRGGLAQIEGSFSPEEASDLALVLRRGSLPAPVKVLEERSVGPSLGADSIRLGRNAVVLGMLLIVIGMAFYYKWSGVVADIALIFNLLLIFAVMVSPPLRATLTLPGLAGAALTIGMAVDANILIFERVREELRLGKMPRAALENGYAKAFSVIFDSNLTTILSALPLIQWGTGPVKGFAVTLVIGLLASLFTALFVTRAIFDYFFLVKRVKTLPI
jgi:preprotein translocase subunit SecD